MSGRFITLEGGEGAGKSTQARLLAAALAAEGLPVLRTREPGGAPGAELLRGLLLNGAVAWSAPAEVLLHFAARAEHVERSIRPALAAGMWVVCDRFADSTMVYQGYGQGADRAAIAALTGMLGVRPDLTLVLDVAVDTSVARLAMRGVAADRYERLGAGFFARIREGFLAVAGGETDRCVVVDAEAVPAAVAEKIWRIVQERLLPSPPPLEGLGREADQGWGEGCGRTMLGHAKAMRKPPTGPEAKLWRALRRTQTGGMKFRRQAPIGGYIVAFFCPEARLVVEIDGASHVEAADDQIRDSWLRGHGYEVLRFRNNEVMENFEGVLEHIFNTARGRTPPPDLGPLRGPSPQGEGE